MRSGLGNRAKALSFAALTFLLLREIQRRISPAFRDPFRPPRFLGLLRGKKST